MENKEIHKKLDRKELRDFLAKELKKAQDKCGYSTVECLEEEYNKIKEKLKNARIKKVVELLIIEQNWQDFDVSEWINYDRMNYFPFIGTKKEYNKIIK